MPTITVQGIPAPQGSKRAIPHTLHRLIPDRPDGKCWPWVGTKFRNGYGAIARFVDGKRHRYMAHRVAYETWVGPIPEGLTIDHLCRNRACCNPAHMEPVTQAVNTQRAMGWLNGRCKRGHELTAANVYVAARTGKRQCRQCWGARRAESRERNAS